MKNKVVVITGGTRGIGYETVKLFLEKGAKVVLLGSREETVNVAISKLLGISSDYDVMGLYPNLASEIELEDAFSKIKEHFGKVDVVICNAGVSSSTPLESYGEEETNKIFDINIKAPFLCSKVACKYLKETKGVLLFTSSMVSIHGQPSGCLYPMSKFAINGLTKSLARELAQFGIRVNAVAPGITETDMVKNLPNEMIEPLKKSIPLGRIGTARDIANAFLFLASDDASYVTGTILQVDGAMRS